MENPKSGRSWSAAPVAKRRKGKHSVVKDLSAPRSSAPKGSRSKHCVDVEKQRASEWFGSRESRRCLALFYRRTRTMCSGLKYCIHAGVPLSSLQAPSFGVMWVAVYGIDSICVVARSKDMLHPQGDLVPPVGTNASDFWNNIISEVEDIAAPPGESSRRFNKSSKKPFGVGTSGESRQKLDKCTKSPFGVVSVIKDTNKVHKASSAEYDAEKAIKFLREEIESGAVFTFDKTTQTTISAFQHLFSQEFEADEIRVFVLKNDEFIGRELKQIREDCDIEELLGIINEGLDERHYHTV